MPFCAFKLGCVICGRVGTQTGIDNFVLFWRDAHDLCWWYYKIHVFILAKYCWHHQSSRSHNHQPLPYANIAENISRYILINCSYSERLKRIFFTLQIYSQYKLKTLILFLCRWRVINWAAESKYFLHRHCIGITLCLNALYMLFSNVTNLSHID